MKLFDRITGRAALKGEIQRLESRLESVGRQARNVRGAVRAAGHFKAAEKSRLAASWDTTPVPINQQLQQELLPMVARSRQLAKNDPYYRRFLGLAKNNVIGHAGFRFAANIKTGAGKPDKRASRAVERAWRHACKKGVLDYRGRLSFQSMCGLMLNSLLRDGEVLALKIRSKHIKPFGFAIQLLDPLLLQLDSDHVPGRPGHQITLGVEFDNTGRRVAYWLHSTDTTHEDYYTLYGRGYIRIPADRIIHEFLDEYVDQVRGFPLGIAAAVRHHMLDKYEDAELSGAVIGASTMGIIERTEDGQGFSGGVEIDDDDDYDYDDDFYMEVEGGTFQEIPHGAKLNTWDPQHPNQAFKDFVKAVLRGIAAALGVSYFTLANDLEGVNYSSGRLGALEDREVWKALQDWFIDNLLRPIFDEWLSQALLMGAVRFQSGTPLSPGDLSRYADGAVFSGRRWAWVDPQKEITAHEKAVALRVASRSEIIRERGREPDEVWDEIERENEELRRRGIDPDAALKQALDKTGGESEGDESEDDEEQEPDEDDG
ncbi:phage portal protein [Microbulbifer thermotolerans]|uniref:phage portal protein n=1 Tax=Microbulbifer thermotolerans TaxID=252514 RepID=UPI00224B6C46|nr:phage portal protein [Microbulbifer thermotolerans]MCX2780419.1 phage portal protein [Microbulbifer thermotolerans]MCX2805909.1 phage portal protein [Microbulbifer thermotolerans]